MKRLTIHARIMMNVLYMVQKVHEGDVEILAVMNVSDLYLWLRRHDGPAIRLFVELTLFGVIS